MADLVCGVGGSTGATIIDRINENTAEAGVNTAKVITIEDRLLALEDLSYYAFAANKGFLGMAETYVSIALLSETIKAGTYEVTMSMTTEFDTLNKAIFTRFTLMGGTAEEFRTENTDINDRESATYTFPYVMASDGLFTLDLEMRKEDVNGVLNCHYANIMLSRKV